MRRLALIAALVFGVFIANAQTAPKVIQSKKTVVTKGKKAEPLKSDKSCCKNEKAMSALRRPVAKPTTATLAKKYN